jgi:hypothetical protein
MATSEEIAPNSFYPNLQDHQVTVSFGWNKRIVDALVRQSQEPEILKHFPRDHYKRFLDSEAANRWFAEDPTVAFYTLRLGKAATLAATAWASGRDRLLDADRTFELRVYEAAEGRSRRELAVGFGNAVLSHLESTAYDGALGLRTDDEDPNRRIYEDLGFRRLGKPTDSHVKMMRPALTSRY